MKKAVGEKDRPKSEAVWRLAECDEQEWRNMGCPTMGTALARIKALEAQVAACATCRRKGERRETEDQCSARTVRQEMKAARGAKGARAR